MAFLALPGVVAGLLPVLLVPGENAHLTGQLTLRPWDAGLRAGLGVASRPEQFRGFSFYFGMAFSGQAAKMEAYKR
jgi:hypothetical protein